MDAQGICVISAVSMCNALGSTRAEIERKLFAGEADALTPQALLLPRGETAAAARAPEPAAEAVLCAAVQHRLPLLPAALAKYQSRLSSMIYSTLQNLQHEIELLRAAYPAERIGIVIGSSTSGIGEAEQAFIDRRNTGTFPACYNYAQQELGAPAHIVQLLTQFSGPCYTISTACSSSAKVFGCAQRLIQLGICDAVLTGGADSLCRLTAQGFNSLELLAEQRSNPFSLNRCGLNLGEGCCLAIVERKTQSSESLIELLGIGEATDAYHISSPDPEARGAILAMRAALSAARISPQAVKYINLHGTGTRFNDSMESLAVHSVFGTGPACSSTKPFTGHQLGASGATEVGLCWYMLSRPEAVKPLLPHVWDGVRDPSLPAIHLAALGESLEFLPGDAVASNSFAFGGSNCVVVLGVSE